MLPANDECCGENDQERDEYAFRRSQGSAPGSVEPGETSCPHSALNRATDQRHDDDGANSKDGPGQPGGEARADRATAQLFERGGETLGSVSGGEDGRTQR